VETVAVTRKNGALINPFVEVLGRVTDLLGPCFCLLTWHMAVLGVTV